MTGQEMLDRLAGGNLDILKPGDVYVIAAVVPEEGVEAITSTSNVIDGGPIHGDAGHRLAIALHLLGARALDLEKT